jgi:NDP-mannose synthase
MTTAIIMAGGRSSRMRASLGRTHKALVKVLGVSMLERNLLTLLSHNFREIFLAIGCGERSLLAFAQGRAHKIAHAGGAELKVFSEGTPLGTIGAAKAIETASDDLLIVNVDNLTSLDLSALVEHHHETKAALTIATHIEPFQVPFGQVSIENGQIVGYAEKPVIPVSLCSGAYVLSRNTRLNIPSGKPIGAPELVNILLRAKQKVSAFCHSSPWIDVNDSSSLDKAEELIMANFEHFELWRQPASEESVTLCVLNGHRVALVRSPSRSTTKIHRLPMEALLLPEETALQSASRLRGKIGMPEVGTPHALVSFDELDTQTGRRTRHHIFVTEKAQGRNTSLPKKGSTISWMLLTDLVKDASRDNVCSRTIAYLERYVESKNSHSLGHRRPILRRG